MDFAEKCKIFIKNFDKNDKFVVNPFTNRTLKKNGQTSKKILRKCNTVRQKNKICPIWYTNKLYNPYTKKKIKLKSETYKFFEFICKLHNKPSKTIKYQRRSQKVNKNAYVWLLMKGDRYAPGVLVSAYSVKRNNPKADIVCMVTKDVTKNTIKQLKIVFDKVITVPYLTYNSRELITKRQESKYRKWINQSYTKWNSINLTKYKKIFFLDADTIATKKLDHVFNLATPAGVFSNPWLRFQKDYYRYHNKKYNSHISKHLIRKGLFNRGFVAYATSILLSPNKENYNKLKFMLKKLQPIGFNSYSGQDEQTIAYFYSLYNYGPKTDWKNITSDYNFIPWRTKDYKKIHVIHYFGDYLPWEISRTKYADLDIWYSIADEMFKKNEKLDIDKLNFKYKNQITTNPKKIVKINKFNLYDLFSKKPYRYSKLYK